MKYVVILLGLLLICSPVLANETGGADWGGVTPPAFADLLVGHTHDYSDQIGQERESPLGIGLDVVVYESDKWYLEEVAVESRFDLENNENAVFFVAKANLWKLLKGK